jgi:hypothetical protein
MNSQPEYLFISQAADFINNQAGGSYTSTDLAKFGEQGQLALGSRSKVEGPIWFLRTQDIEQIRKNPNNTVDVYCAFTDPDAVNYYNKHWFNCNDHNNFELDTDRFTNSQAMSIAVSLEDILIPLKELQRFIKAPTKLVGPLSHYTIVEHWEINPSKRKQREHQIAKAVKSQELEPDCVMVRADIATTQSLPKDHWRGINAKEMTWRGIFPGSSPSFSGLFTVEIFLSPDKFANWLKNQGIEIPYCSLLAPWVTKADSLANIKAIPAPLTLPKSSGEKARVYYAVINALGRVPETREEFARQIEKLHGTDHEIRLSERTGESLIFNDEIVTHDALGEALRRIRKHAGSEEWPPTTQ